MPDVSVIIPTRNRPELTAQAAQSALCEVDLAVEVLIVDDGSDEYRPEVFEALKGDVRVLRQARSGASAARNHAMNQATGEFIKFLDSDDLLATGSLSAQVNTLRESGADICYGDFDFIGNLSDPRIGGRPRRVSGQVTDVITALLSDWWTANFAYLYRRSAIQPVRWNEELDCLQDLDFILKCALRNMSCVYVPGVSGFYRIHSSEQITNQTAERYATSLCLILDMAEAELRASGRLDTTRADRIAHGYWSAARKLYRTDRGAFEDCIRRIAEVRPEFRPSGQGWVPRLTRWVGVRRAERILALGRSMLSPVRRIRSSQAG